MAEHSPTPWRVEKSEIFSNLWIVRCDNGEPIATALREADAALIVEAANESDRLEQKHADEIAKLLAQREKLYKELGNASDAAIRAIRERDRLRDIMRGLVAILETITLEDHEIELLDEARKAIKEDEP